MATPVMSTMPITPTTTITTVMITTGIITMAIAMIMAITEQDTRTISERTPIAVT